MSQDSTEVSLGIRDFYETYSYPNRAPGASIDPFLELMHSFTDSPQSARSSFLDAGCGTGYSVLGAASLYPHFDVVGCDINRVALKAIKDDAERHGLSNLTLHELDLLNLSTEIAPVGGFDLIYSTGVIHHTADPQKVLATMGELLAPTGVLRLMVYGQRGRTDLYRFATATQMLFPAEKFDLKERLHSSKALMKMLQEHGETSGLTPPCLRGPWNDALRANDAEFVDRYLNPCDQPYTLESLRTAIKEADLEFLRWYEPRDWDLETLLPGLADQIPGDVWQQFELIDQLFDRPRLDLYLVKPGRQARATKVDPDTYLGLSPQAIHRSMQVRGVRFQDTVQVRLGPEEPLSKTQAQMMGAFGRRFLTLRALAQELPELTLDEWTPIAQELVDREVLFCPHTRPSANPLADLFSRTRK